MTAHGRRMPINESVSRYGSGQPSTIGRQRTGCALDVPNSTAELLAGDATTLALSSGDGERSRGAGDSV